MKTQEQVEKYTDERFYRAFGVKRPVFAGMMQILEEASKAEHKQGGKPLKVSLFDRLCIFFMYFHDYMTMEAIANEYNVVPSTAHRLITWVRDTLVKSGKFRLPGKRSLATAPPATVWIDATECETERPQKNSGAHTPGKRNATPTSCKS